MQDVFRGAPLRQPPHQVSKMSAMKFSRFEWGDASEGEEESVRSEKWLVLKGS